MLLNTPRHLLHNIGSNITLVKQKNQIKSWGHYGIQWRHLKKPQDKHYYKRNSLPRWHSQKEDCWCECCLIISVWPKFLELNEHILSNRFNWDGIHLHKSGTMALATKISEDIQPSTRSDAENRLQTQPNPRKDKQKFIITIYNVAKAQKMKVFLSRQKYLTPT